MLPLSFIIFAEIAPIIEGGIYGIIGTSIVGVIAWICRTYIRRSKDKEINQLEQTKEENKIHLDGAKVLIDYYHKLIDELQDSNKQLIEANTVLRTDFLDKIEKLIKENATLQIQSHLILKQTKETAETIKNGNGNGKH